MTNKDLIALNRLSLMGDWLKLKDFDSIKLLDELKQFDDEWKKYNPTKIDKRFGLSVTSLDGSLSGIPDLDSLSRYNDENNTSLTNRDIKKLTTVYEKCPTLQAILEPFLPWLGRCHFIKLNSGGFFPEHYDNEKVDSEEDLRLIAFIKNNKITTYKFCYNDELVKGIEDGQLYYFNAHKKHSVFSMIDNCIQLVICLKFDEALFHELLKQYEIQ